GPYPLSKKPIETDMEQGQTRHERPTILVVDDHIEILDFIAEDLSDSFEVLKAADGFRAMELLAGHPVQLVVSDVMMPEMDGYELCRRIKSDVEHSHIPVVLLTA